jgi:SPP1 gp7 family putative phage head morphogenesis protein
VIVRLQPVLFRDQHAEPVAAELMAYFQEVLFAPIEHLFDEAGFPIDIRDRKRRRENASTAALDEALREGRVWTAKLTVRGARRVDFFGEFDSRISRELHRLGARFDPHERYFSLPADRLPMELSSAADGAAARARDLHQRTVDLLDDMATNLPLAPTGLQFQPAIDKVVGDLQRQFTRAVAGLDFVSVPAQISPGAAAALRDQLTQNLGLSIKRFSADAISDLRERVQANASAGWRADRLADIIQAERGVSRRRADFLSKQETSLFVSKLREHRYREVGCRQYVWSDSGDARVRDDHHHLNGRTFSWDQPPIVDRAHGRRANPGEDYGCRCVPIAILSWKEEAA